MEVPLAAGFVARRPEAFAQAYEAYSVELCSVARHVLRDRVWAEESVYDTLLRVWRSPGAYRAERGSLRAFLLVAVRNDALDQLRGETRRSAAEEAAHHLEPLEEDVQLVDAFEAVRVRDAIADLEEEQRDVILRAYYKNRTAEEIAEDTRIPIEAIQTRLRSAFAELASDLSGDYRECHLGDSASRHALGLLDSGERAALERLSMSCPDCLRLVGLAEETSARLAAVFPRVEPSTELLRRLSDLPSVAARTALPAEPDGLGAFDGVGGRALRMAARWARERRRSARLETRAYVAALAIVALIVGLAFAILHVQQSDKTLRADALALNLVARSTVAVANLTPSSDLAPRAKVIYDKGGSWLYVLVQGNTGTLHVVVTGADVRDLGEPLQRGDVSTLFVTNAGKPQRVSLRDTQGIVASATLKY